MSESGVPSRANRRPVDHAVERVNLLPLLSAARVTVVAGKGGVGKTTVTAVLATAAARAGMRVLAIELDGKPILAELLGEVPHLALSAQLALEEYLRDHGFGRVAKRLSSSGVIDVVSTAAPGIDDIVVLGKIKQLERSGDWDTIIVDGPAAGHAVTMMTSASGLQNAVSGGPVRAQADDVLGMLRDPDRLQVALVTLPETTPVNETVETAFRLEDRVGVRLAPVIVDGVDVDVSAPVETLSDRVAAVDVSDADRAALAAAAAFRDEWRAVQRAAIGHLATSLPLGQVHVPWVPTARLDAQSVDELASAATVVSVLDDVDEP
jgi:anion-transporting  ArsA/GET3 family ATPase